MATLDRGSSEPNALLKDLYEKKQNLRRIASEVGSMASELRDVRGRMTAQESALEQESARRQTAEAKAKTMEREIEHLQKSLEERSNLAISTASVAEQYLRELMELRAKLGSAQEAAEARAASATTVHLQCKALLKEIEKKSEEVQEHEEHAIQLDQQLIKMQLELRLRESCQKQLQEEVERLRAEVKLAVANVTANKDSEMKKLLEEVAARNADQMAKHLSVKDEETGRLKEEIKQLSANLKSKAQELEVQMEKQHRADQEMKKRVIKLEFWLQEARTQTRKLQRIAERKEKEIKDLRAQLCHKEANSTAPKGVTRFWGSSRFKILMSVSVVVLAVLAKR